LAETAENQGLKGYFVNAMATVADTISPPHRDLIGLLGVGDLTLSVSRSTVRTLAFGAAILLALGLAGCGRRGPLDLPPSDTPSPQANLTQPAFGPSSMMPGSSQQQPAAHTPNAVDANGHPIYQPPASHKSFILDPILGPLPDRQ
jgi:predicted small lipoprotein YifL